MPTIFETTMQTLYGGNIWDAYTPSRPAVKVEGWNSRLPILKRLAVTTTPHVIIDVGVWKGKSTIFLAQALKAARLDGCVLAVDTFLGSGEHWSGNKQGSIGEFERRQGMPDIFDQFLANVAHSDMADTVIPMPQTSITAARILQRLRVKAGLVHLDASHDYADVVADIEAYWPIVAANGGVLLGDDYGWAGVQQAADEFAKRQKLELTVDGPKWFVRKPGPKAAIAAAAAAATA